MSMSFSEGSDNENKGQAVPAGDIRAAGRSLEVEGLSTPMGGEGEE
jgi:hypothetical protein